MSSLRVLTRVGIHLRCCSLTITRPSLLKFYQYWNQNNSVKNYGLKDMNSQYQLSPNVKAVKPATIFRRQIVLDWYWRLVSSNKWNYLYKTVFFLNIPRLLFMSFCFFFLQEIIKWLETFVFPCLIMRYKSSLDDKHLILFC